MWQNKKPVNKKHMYTRMARADIEYAFASMHISMDHRDELS